MADEVGEISPHVFAVTPVGSESIGYYRMLMPLAAAHCLGVKGSLVAREPDDADIFYHDRKNATKTYLVATHLTYRVGAAERIKKLRSAGHRVLVDIDDYVWKANIACKQQIQEFEESLSLAWKVTCSTAYLKSKIKLHTGIHAALVPNAISQNQFMPAIERGEDAPRLRVIYTGSFRHSTEWPIIKKLVCETSDFATWILFYGRGVNTRGEFVRLVVPPELADVANIEWQMPQMPETFLSTAYNLGPHVAVAPLAANFLNHAKSDLKILEAAALGIPIVTQDLTPYENWQWRGDFGLILDFLRALHKDEQVRREIAEETINYGWERRVEGQKYLYSILMNWFSE